MVTIESNYQEEGFAAPSIDEFVILLAIDFKKIELSLFVNMGFVAAALVEIQRDSIIHQAI